MQVPMRHPDYGATHAYNDKQVAELLKRGFLVEEEKRPVLVLPKKRAPKSK